MEEVTLFACGDFWNDLKDLKGSLSKAFVDCPFTEEDFNKLSCVQKMDCVPLLNSISTAIKNKNGKLQELPNNKRNGQQPLLEKDFVLWKMRWAIDKRGPRAGLRIMYVVKGNIIVFSAMKRKKDIADDESGFQALTIERLKAFFAVNPL